ncbi:MAG: hypothetical protein OXG11_04060 [Chloroflexi bacterium]|nr:hypothetical protein [Chloroflexota bacterium]
MGFWRGETLRERLPSIVKKPHYSEERIDCNAYTMRLGEEIYISPSRQEAVGAPKEKLEPRSGRTIPPGQFAVLLTEEYVEIPGDAMAFISMRSTQKLRGLVNVSGFHVDPGYRGRLVFAVFNASANYVHLHREEPCFLIWFADLDGKSAPPFTKTEEGFVDIPSKLVNPLGNAKVESIDGLSARLNGVEERLRLLTGIVLLAAGTVVAGTIGQCREAWGERPAPVTVVVPGASLPGAAGTGATPGGPQGAVGEREASLQVDESEAVTSP